MLKVAEVFQSRSVNFVVIDNPPGLVPRPRPASTTNTFPRKDFEEEHHHYYIDPNTS